MRDSRMEIGAGDRPELVKTATDGDQQRLATEARRLDELALPGLVEPIRFDPRPPAVLRLRWVGSHTLATARPEATEAIASLVAEVAEVVAALHDRGLGHTALIAEHVLLDGEGRPVLAGTGNLTELEAGQAADQVAAIGALLADLVGDTTEVEPIPERRGRRHRWTGFARRALATLSDQALAEEREVRPTAASLAESLRSAGGAERPSPRSAAPPRTTHAPVDPATGDPPSPEPEPVVPVALADHLAERSDDGALPPEPPADGQEAEGEPLPEAAREGSPARAPLLGSLATGSVPGPGERLRRTMEGRAGRIAALAAVITGAALLLVGVISFTDGGPRPSLQATGPSGAGLGRGNSPPPDAGPAPQLPGPSTTAADSDPSPRDEPTTQHETPEPCPEVAADTGTVDANGDGCGEPVQVEAERVTVGDVSYQVGRSGDRVAVADWDCDGDATPAVVRPATGEVFIFDGWATSGAEVSVDALTRVSDSQRPSARDADDDGCPELVVTREGAPAAVIAVGAGS